MMHRVYKGIFVLPLLSLLTGCVAHLSQQQCMATDWKNVGFQDGSAGKFPRDLTTPTADCMKFGIQVNSSAYQTGWRQGARQFCTPDANVGYADGAAGKSTNDIYGRQPICAQAGISLNLSSYNAGRQRGLQTFCTYENGMNLARQGQPLPDVCSSASKFNAGWAAGKNQFCSQPENAFALGKAGKPYPDLCPPSLYIAFKSEYDRGAVIGQRMSDAQAQIDGIDNEISEKVSRYSLRDKGGYYKLGHDKSPEAQAALDRVNFLIGQKQQISSEVFNLQVMR